MVSLLRAREYARVASTPYTIKDRHAAFSEVIIKLTLFGYHTQNHVLIIKEGCSYVLEVRVERRGIACCITIRLVTSYIPPKFLFLGLPLQCVQAVLESVRQKAVKRA